MRTSVGCWKKSKRESNASVSVAIPLLKYMPRATRRRLQVSLGFRVPYGCEQTVSSKRKPSPCTQEGFAPLWHRACSDGCPPGRFMALHGACGKISVCSFRAGKAFSFLNEDSTCHEKTISEWSCGSRWYWGMRARRCPARRKRITCCFAVSTAAGNPGTRARVRRRCC